jgi:predicted PurR-regulated permease PerM
MNERLLNKSIKIMLLAVLAVFILIQARAFIIPLVFAGLFSMLLLPVSHRLEGWGMYRGFAVVISVLLFLSLIAGVIYLLVWQVGDLSVNAAEIEKNLTKNLQDLRDFISRTFGISAAKQEEIIQGQPGTDNANVVSRLFSSLGSFLTNFILVMVYTFLFLYFRLHLKKFILMLVNPANRNNANGVLEEGKGVAQKYITGLSLMILSLWIMYGIGFSIIGVRHALLFAVLCGLLEIVPYIGNITGTAITMLAVAMQGGNTSMIIGVLITYSIVQFLQTYILEPLVVGKGVNINPLFTIAGIVAGELIWGIPGMILAIPLLGITKIICDHIEPLKPYGFLIGIERRPGPSLLNRVKQWVK